MTRLTFDMSVTLSTPRNVGSREVERAVEVALEDALGYPPKAPAKSSPLDIVANSVVVRVTQVTSPGAGD